MIAMYLACNSCRYRTQEFVEYGGTFTTMLFQHQKTHALRFVVHDRLQTWVQERLGRSVEIREADRALDEGLYATLVSEYLQEDEVRLSPMSVWPGQRALVDAFCPQCRQKGLEIVSTGIV
jgi:hypothetical protein